MRIKLLKIGKPAFRELSSIVDEYTKRLRTLAPALERLEWKELDDKKLSQLLDGGAYLVALDETGKELKSSELATQLTRWLDDPGVKTLVFLIGGPYGLSDYARKRANFLWSLSKGTLQGDLAWLVATEQIYRAFTLIRGMPYHHE